MSMSLKILLKTLMSSTFDGNFIRYCINSVRYAPKI